jgi:2-dehydro-3-deoxygalactonokinase
MGSPVRILIDWGTTNFRAVLVGAGGRSIDRLERASGILSIPPGGFPAAFDGMLAGWREAYPDAPVMMCGMVGSRQGWVETPYVAAPASLEALARGLTPVPDHGNVWIVPGVSCQEPGGIADVMRGEETQIMGASAGEGRELICLPGTHAKWVEIEDRRIVRFATAMTGEVWQVLRRHSILGRLMPEAHSHDAEAFRRGLLRSREEGGLLHHLFGVRTEGLFGRISAEGLSSYLSGLLIGHEIAGLADMGEKRPITIIGARELADIYRLALGIVGFTTRFVEAEEAVVLGLQRIAAVRLGEGA